MTTLDFDATALRTTPRGAVARRAVNWIAASFTAWQNRRAFYRLSELSDIELRDIGLSRGDLSVALSLGKDPTVSLRTITHLRREKVEPVAALRV